MPNRETLQSQSRVRVKIDVARELDALGVCCMAGRVRGYLSTALSAGDSSRSSLLGSLRCRLGSGPGAGVRLPTGTLSALLDTQLSAHVGSTEDAGRWWLRAGGGRS